jgi:hypothetical protein
MLFIANPGEFKRFLPLMMAVLICNNTYSQKPVLIQFGWGYADVTQLSKGLDSMQNTPFDGLCFSLQRRIMEAFDTASLGEPYFEYDKLKSLHWGKYKDNYIVLRGFSKTGGNWLDDKAWQTITKNIEKLSKAILLGKCRGVLFDPEYYYNEQLYNPWTYNGRQYPGISFEKMQDTVRTRGIQFITALQKYSSDFSFISIWLASLVTEDLKLSPLEKTRHALLLSFIEGILLGKNKSVNLIDGNEYGYWYTKPSQFLNSTGLVKKSAIALMRSQKAKTLAEEIKTAQPVFYDGLLAKAPSFEKGVDNESKWRWLEENLKYAAASSSSGIVWFYYQRIDWWSGKVNDTLINILQNSKKIFTPAIKGRGNSNSKQLLSASKNVNTGKGYFYFSESKMPMRTGKEAFIYGWDRIKKRLTILFKEKVPTTFSVYSNSILAASISPIRMKASLKLKAFTSGRLTFLCQYNDDSESSAIQEY